MRRRTSHQLVLDLDHGGRPIPSATPPDGLLQALADLLLEALGQQNQATTGGREASDAAQDHA